MWKVIRAYGTTLEQNYQTYSYTPNGQAASVADANGNLTSYVYDGHDRLYRWRFPSKTTAGVSSASDYEQYAYDGNGNRTSLRKRDGTVIGYAYDALNRLTFKDLPGTAADVSYGYDLRGSETSVARPGYAISRTYDKAGRRLSAVAGGRAVSYLYDKAGHRTRITHPDGVYFSYDYDALGRVAAIKEQGSASLASYAYDGLSRRTTVTYGNGTTISYAYEPDSALDQLTNDVAGAAQDVAYGFDYNRVNQILTRTLSNPLYRWDGHRNQARSYAHNGLNQVTQVGLQALSHDANGNLTGDGTWTYGYDAENRLIAASKAGVDAAYGYDGLGRRTSKTVNGSSTHYLHDGDALIAEYAGASGDSPLRRYAHGPGVDEPIVVYDGSGVTAKRWLYRNWQGSIVALADASGAVASADIYTYGPYGEPNATAGSIFRYTGQILDAETGLYYYKTRYYSPALGRFLQTDPIGYEDQMNLYAYVHNDPVNMVDPSGRVAIADDAAIALTVTVVAGGAVYIYWANTPEGERTLQGAADAVSNTVSNLWNAVFNESNEGPAAPGDIVGEDPGEGGSRTNSGPLSGENGGTGDADKDFEKLTGGRSGPAPEGSSLPEALGLVRMRLLFAPVPRAKGQESISRQPVINPERRCIIHHRNLKKMGDEKGNRITRISGCQ